VTRPFQRRASRAEGMTDLDDVLLRRLLKALGILNRGLRVGTPWLTAADIELPEDGALRGLVESGLARAHRKPGGERRYRITRLGSERLAEQVMARHAEAWLASVAPEK
jgi:hypothetical protein